MAWLHAVPQPHEGAKQAVRNDRAAQVSRLDRYKKDGFDPPMPPNILPQVVNRLIRLGITEVTGMGPVPLKWGEIGDYQRGLGLVLPPWEIELLRSLSVAYVAESGRAKSDDCPPPWRECELDLAEQSLKLALG